MNKLHVKTLLSDGIKILKQEDNNVKKLISPRFDQIVSLLELYVKEIETFNAAYGLVGAQSTEELVIKHILDSLGPLGIISALISDSPAGIVPARIADAGSGAGFPGIPLAICLPEYKFTLIERMEKRTGFLWNVKAVLGLDNITIEEGELEKTEKNRFSLITFRAFKPLDKKLLKSLFAACTPDGIIAAYKGKYEKTKQEIEPFKNLYKCEIIPCRIPFLNEERHLLVLKRFP